MTVEFRGGPLNGTRSHVASTKREFSIKYLSDTHRLTIGLYELRAKNGYAIVLSNAMRVMDFRPE